MARYFIFLLWLARFERQRLRCFFFFVPLAMPKLL